MQENCFKKSSRKKEICNGIWCGLAWSNVVLCVSMCACKAGTLIVKHKNARRFQQGCNYAISIHQGTNQLNHLTQPTVCQLLLTPIMIQH